VHIQKNRLFLHSIKVPENYQPEFEGQRELVVDEIELIPWQRGEMIQTQLHSGWEKQGI